MIPPDLGPSALNHSNRDGGRVLLGERSRLGCLEACSAHRGRYHASREVQTSKALAHRSDYRVCICHLQLSQYNREHWTISMSGHFISYYESKRRRAGEWGKAQQSGSPKRRERCGQTRIGMARRTPSNGCLLSGILHRQSCLRVWKGQELEYLEINRFQQSSSHTIQYFACSS